MARQIRKPTAAERNRKTQERIRKKEIEDLPAATPSSVSLAWTTIRLRIDPNLSSGTRDPAEWALLDDLLLLRGTVSMGSGFTYGLDWGYIDLDLTPFYDTGPRINSALNVNYRQGLTSFKDGYLSLGNRGGVLHGGFDNMLLLISEWDGGSMAAGATFYLDGHIRLHGDA